MCERVGVPRTLKVVERGPAGSVELLPGAHFPGDGVVVIDEHPTGLHVEVEVVPHAGRLIVREVRASRDDGKQVTLEALRQLPLKPYLAQAGGLLFLDPKVFPRPMNVSKDWVTVAWGLLDVEDRDRLRAQGPTKETLRWAALVYRFADLIAEPPVKSVAGAFGVSARTATNWVAAARSGGFLPSEES